MMNIPRCILLDDCNECAARQLRKPDARVTVIDPPRHA
jgi:hypothetical protein